MLKITLEQALASVTPLVGNFRGSAEKKRKLQGIS